MDASLNAPLNAQHRVVDWVWYTGTDAILEGEAVCYDIGRDSTAADFDARRTNTVSRPRRGNNLAFAGVAARDYSPKSTGQFIEINCPGSKGVNIALGANTVVNTGIINFVVDEGNASGRFVRAGYLGRGAAVPRQTVTGVIKESYVGGWSLATNGKTLTAATHTASIGDVVVLLRGKDEGDDKTVVPGKYVIESVTDANTVVLKDSAVGDTPAGTLTGVSGYIIRNNPKCQADLLDGEESGGVEFLSPPATGGATAVTFMVGGITVITGALTVGDADAAGPLADGAFLGMKKGFHCLNTLTTNEVAVILATAGRQRKVDDGSGVPLALKKATFDAANERLHLAWKGLWEEEGYSGATVSTTS